jgi:hypothetical protein
MRDMDVVMIVGLVVGLALLVGVIVTVRGRRAASRPDDGSLEIGETICPSCGHKFKRPAIMVLTEADLKKYGRNPVQCPRCGHIWNAGGKPRRTIRS